MSSLTLSSSRGISRLVKAMACSRQGAPTVWQCVSRTRHKCTAMTFVPVYYGRNAAPHLRYPVGWASQLRVYSSPAPSVQQKTEIIKKKVRSLLEEEPTGPAKMPTGDLSIDEKNKASSLIPHYLVRIASDPQVQHESILELFRLYALTMRPLAHDKIDYPEEFKCIIPATEHAFHLMSISELHAMSQYLSCLECQKLALIQNLTRALCQECAARLHRKPTFMEAMSLYNLALTMSPRSFPRNCHDIFNEYLLHNIDNASLKEKVKLMYFSSLNPRPSYTSLFEELIKSVVPHVSSMPFKLQGVVASSVLKSGVTLHRDLPLLPELVPNLVNCLLSNNQLDDLEAFCIVSEIDLMRLSYYNNEDVTAALESFLISCNEENCLTIENMKCFLAFLASRSYNQMVFEKLEAYLVEILCDETRESLLLADLARILWAMSAASHKCSDAFIEEVKRELHSQVAVGLINANLLKFVDALTSLAAMGHVDLNLCRHAFGKRKGKAVAYGGHLEVKLYSRIASLRECLSIERPEVILPAPINPSVSSVASEPTSLLHQRPALGKLHTALNTALAESPGVALSFGCPLTTIKLAGICLRLKHEDSGAQITGSSAPTPGSSVTNHVTSAGRENEVYSESGGGAARLLECLVQLQHPVSLEVLDATSTIAEGSSRRYSGLLNYKMRLMEKIGWKCVLVSQMDIEESDDVMSLVVDKLQESCIAL